MADETIKIDVQINPQPAQQGAQQVGRAVETLGQQVERVGSVITSALSGQAFAAARENVAAIYGAVRDGAEALSRSAGESERLSRATRTLGVDFDEAARSAGGVADGLDLLNAAGTLSARGISFTQAQLNAFARTAQDYARGTGKELREAAETLADSLAEGGEEAAKFGPALGALQASTFTAAQRMEALVEATRGTVPAARTAAEGYRDLQQAITDAQRGFAEGFAEGLAEIRRVHGETSSARDVMRELKDDVYALGGATATVFAAMADGARVVVTEVSGVVEGIGDAVDTLRQLRSNPLAAGEILRGFQGRSDARERASADAFDRLMRTLRGEERTTLDVGGGPSQAPVARGRGLAIDTELGRTGAGSDAAFAEANRAAGARAAANDNAASTPLLTVGSAELNALFERELGRAESRGAEDLGRLGSAALQTDFVEGIRQVTGVARGDAAARFGDPLSEIDARNAAANRRQAGGAPGDRMDARESARRQRELDAQLDAQQSYTDRMRDLHSERASLAQSEADAVTMSFNAMGQALGRHVAAVVGGQESIAVGLQAMLSDTLTAIGTEAIVKGAMQMAEGAAALAGIITAPLAPGHFAAGAAFVGVGALVASLGGAIAPSASGAAPSSGGSAPAMPSAPVGATAAASNDNARGGPTEITINLGGGVVLGSARELGEALGRVVNDPSAGVSINANRVRRAGGMR